MSSPIATLTAQIAALDAQIATLNAQRDVLEKARDKAYAESGNLDGWTKVADEGGRKDFGKTLVDVAYGAKGRYVYRNGVSGVVWFNNTAFGSDPFPREPKFGYYRPAMPVVEAADRRCQWGGIASGSMPSREASVELFAAHGLKFVRDFITATDKPSLDSPTAYRAKGIATVCTWTHPQGQLCEGGLRKYVATLTAGDAMTFVNEWSQKNYWASQDRKAANALARARSLVVRDVNKAIPCGGPSFTGNYRQWREQIIADYEAGEYENLQAFCVHSYNDYNGAPSSNVKKAKDFHSEVAEIVAEIAGRTGLRCWMTEAGCRDCEPSQAAEIIAHMAKVYAPTVDKLAWFITANSYKNGVAKDNFRQFAWFFDPITGETRPVVSDAIRAAAK
jgi:hypothetical protein